jgi:hypothetical protein
MGILGHTTAQAQIGGVPLWTNRQVSGIAMAVDSSGYVLVTGKSWSPSGYFNLVTKYSGAGAPLWTNIYSGPGNNVAIASVVDGSGNVFVTGNSFGVGLNDYTIIAYSGAGVLLWEYDGGGVGAPSAMAVDSSGNVFVTGRGSSDYATIKCSGAGVPLWTNRYNGPGSSDDTPYAMVVDRSGHLLVTGSSYGANGDPDYATIKYSGAGVPLWTNRYNGPGNSTDGASAVAVDGNGNVFVTGSSIGIDGHFEYATIAYSGAGVPLWTNRYKGPGATAVAVDGSGCVFVTGSDFATIKYSGAGVPLWTNRYERGLSAGNDLATAVAVDGGGNVFIAGTAYTSSNTHDGLTIAYSSTGVPLWTNRYYVGIEYSPSSATCSVATDGSGNVFVTGTIASSVNVGQSVSATIKYSSAIPPSLTITRTTTNTVAISWPSPSAGFTLQQNINGIAMVNWSNVVATPSDDGTIRSLIVDPPVGSRFYRLFHP